MTITIGVKANTPNNKNAKQKKTYEASKTKHTEKVKHPHTTQPTETGPTHDQNYNRHDKDMTTKKKFKRDEQTPEQKQLQRHTPTTKRSTKKPQRQKQKRKQKQRTFHAETTVISENQRPNPHTPTTTHLQHQSMTRRESTRTPHQNYSGLESTNATQRKDENGTNNR
jgi:hypothetical protein